MSQKVWQQGVFFKAEEDRVHQEVDKDHQEVDQDNQEEVKEVKDLLEVDKEVKVDRALLAVVDSNQTSMMASAQIKMLVSLIFVALMVNIAMHGKILKTIQ